MKILAWKKIAVAAVAAGLAITGILYFTSDTVKTNPRADINPAFAEHIASYTTGIIPSGSPLTVVLNNDVIDSTLVGKETETELFDFSPALSGKTVWLDRRTVEFRPEDRMMSGKVYSARFFLSRLKDDLPEGMRTFEYSFQVMPQNFEVVVVNTKPYVKTDLKREKIEGTFHTADFAEATEVEKTVDATQEGNALKLTWTHGEDGRQHHFVVEDVSRKQAQGKVNIRVNGNPIGIDRRQDLEVDIPAINDFRLMRVRVVQSPTQYVVLQFSDPVRDNQNLNGLIRITDLSSLDFDIHDNEIWVYPPIRQNGTRTLSVGSGIRNVLDKRLERSSSEEVVFEQVKPAVRFAGKGSILPGTQGLVVPFEAVNLSAVDIQITRIHENNILQFFQVNSLDSHNELRRVGNRILKKRIPLDNTGITDPGKWNRYTLDITKLIQAEPGAIYEVKLGFRQAYSLYGCETSGVQTASPAQFESPEDDHDDGFQGEWSYDYYDDYYYGEDFDWRQRDNPCNSSYYTSDKSVTKNILASDLGVTAKRGGDGNTLVFVTDLKTAKPVGGVEISLYSYQLQALATAVTDGEGKVVMNTKETPFSLVAKNGSQRGYVRMVNGEALMVSNFDVSGQVVQKGLKGFLYGERGVWRPGDSLFVTFILEDKRELLPENHPVVFELSNPQGQVMQRIVRAASVNGFYNFATATASDAPTGNWLGRVKVGGTEFTQTLKIETVKPNRLKINLDFGTAKLTSADLNGTLEVKWLHGAPGRNLKAEFDVMLQRQVTQFSGFPQYNFDDPSREFQSETQLLFEGKTDLEGRAAVTATLERSGAPSGLLNAVFRGKVFEESGNFSIDRFSIPYYPYASFVGMRVPEGERYSGILYTDTPHKIALATVDTEGKGVSREGIEVNMYKLDWRWWWDNTNESMANYVEGSYSTLAKSGTVKTTNGKGEWTFNLEAAEYGRYFLRACDPVSGHCAGQIIYVDEPGWYSRARADDARGGANLLSFSADKTQYNIGEKINLTIPGSEKGRALVSIENGSKVLQTYWVETTQGETRFAVDVTPEMAPNVYVHVSLLQPHAQTENDLPIRLYGVTGVQVEDPATHLEPLLAMPEVLVPGEPVAIRVSEKANRKMTYTLAVVDEGLLDLTRFKTPDPWKSFYAREALGVRTWDLYDQVMGAFGANLERFISIGGDDALAAAELDPLANRFKPVVKFFGPYTLDGGAQEIKFIMPQYIGSVKTMLVAGHAGSYGKAEKVSAVRKPLMVLATLPRVLGPEEVATLPVTLFTGEKNLDNVDVEVNVTGPLEIKGDKKKSLSLSKDADATIEFELGVRSETGVAKVEVIATSGNLKSVDVIEIQVRNPNLPVTRVEEFLLEEKKDLATSIHPFGMAGTNTAILEVSSLPPINLGSRMRYLLQYPHGCIEQVTSSVFPQLYLSQVRALTEAEQAVIQENVKAGIEQLKSFVQPDGGFVYWPGLSESSDSWGTSYAGHFLIEAEARGYYVPADLLQRWKGFQRNRATEWRSNKSYVNSQLIQAYRLYTLALAGSPELGAMNRLREESDLIPSAAWMLASAFVISGQTEASRKLIQDLPLSVKPYREMDYTYGSALRDKALIIETLVLLDDKVRAFEVLREISTALGDQGNWMSTQETAMCLRAVGAFASGYKRGDLNFTYRVGKDKTVSATTGLPYAQIEIPVKGVNAYPLEVVNKSAGVLFTRLITTGTPARGEETDDANELALTIRYTDPQGNLIDPSRMEQGTEFVAEVTVTHPGVRGPYENLALSQVFPPGWEISNLRLDEAEEILQTSPFRYQDIRDDRVFTYFNLAPREEKTFRVLVTATYAGTFYLPAVSCEAMYDGSVYARKKGRTVVVEKNRSR
ncbi:MAG: MG2 domain-containing protein [Chryseosolibacter sp.]